VEKLIRSFETIYDVLTATEKISEVTDLELEEEGGMKVRENTESKGLSIRAEGLSYLSPATGQPILRDIDLDIPSGQRLCISGFNGSGKSTLLNALAGLYEKYTGQLLFNGIPRKNVNINELRAEIGDNLAHEDVFHGTIKENITMGQEDVSDRAIQEAVEFSGLNDFINRLPKGYETVIGPEGFSLPRSVVKSIILARSVARAPLLMAMEDDLTQFEHAEKQRIITYLTDPSHPWTLLIISNDREVMEACDRVIVLKDGTIIANDGPDGIRQEPWYDDVFS
jgi:ABC-type bacteriocin/lantibiotic exporter with double-glycine peptidase domain